MVKESKTPKTPDGTIIAPCYGCGVGIPSRPRDVMWARDEEGNTRIVMSFNQCDDCEVELDRRLAQREIDDARRKAEYEKSLADLLNSVPKKTEKQIGFDMGID